MPKLGSLKNGNQCLLSKSGDSKFTLQANDPVTLGVFNQRLQPVIALKKLQSYITGGMRIGTLSCNVMFNSPFFRGQGGAIG